jgi:hypothetical protein
MNETVLQVALLLLSDVGDDERGPPVGADAWQGEAKKRSNSANVS